MTNHSYFNLNGQGRGTILTHIAQIDADYITETDRRLITTGTLLPVRWTPMDFRTAKVIGEEIANDYEPLHFGNGYDHNFVLNGSGEEYRQVGYLYSAESGIKMTVLTDMPGMQLYTGNFLDGEAGKNDSEYLPRNGVCLETQFWPDAINKDNFPGGTLTEGETFTSRTTYAFSICRDE